MCSFSLDNTIKVLRKCVEIILVNKDALTEIDSIGGDGDLGVSMEKGAIALKSCLHSLEGEETISSLLVRSGTVFSKAAPSTMGTLLGMSLMSLGTSWKNKEVLTMEDVIDAPRIMASTIARLGKAKPGDKTILDALCPFAQSLEEEYSSSKSFVKAYGVALEAARNGFESTKGMVASVGRARWLGQRAAETHDGGALLCLRVLEGLSPSKQDR